MPNQALKWNKPPVPVDTTDTSAIVLNYDNVQGLRHGVEQALTIASGYVLPAGIPLVNNGAGSMIPHSGFSEQCLWTLAGDVVPTATKNTVLTVAGITLTFTGTMTVANLMSVLKGAKPGQTGSAIVTASGVSGVAGSGTLAGWYPVVDTANKKILWVSSSYNTNVSNLTFTLVDTASSPVDLSSNVTAVTTPLSMSKVDGILVNPVNTTSAAKKVPVLVSAEGYADLLTLVVEPDTDTDLIDGALPGLYAAGIFTYEQLSLSLLGSMFKLRNTLTAL